VIDELRSVEGVELAMTVREPPEPPGAPCRISMRSATDALDVSAIARQRGGGGHPRAAGFSSDGSVEEIIEFVRSQFADAGNVGHINAESGLGDWGFGQFLLSRFVDKPGQTGLPDIDYDPIASEQERSAVATLLYGM